MTPRMLDRMRRVVPYVVALVAVGIVTALIGAVESRGHVSNISMLYLIVVLAAATLAGRGPAISASLTAFLADLLQGVVRVPFLPDDFPSAEPVFRQLD